jgi:hypothetical protein
MIFAKTRGINILDESYVRQQVSKSLKSLGPNLLIIIINRNLVPRSGAHMEDLIYIYSWKGKKWRRINTIYL